MLEHGKAVIATDEYKDWEKSFKNIEEFDASKSEDSPKIQVAQKAIKNYSEVQSQYLLGSAKATDEDSYNEVNTQLAMKLSELETKYVEKMQEFSY